jgi:hypothetical protein
METFVLDVDNKPSMKFVGERIASTSSSVEQSSNYYSGSVGRWTDLELYKTKGGKWICHQTGHSQWDGEHTRYTGAVCGTEEEVIAFFGHGWLAKYLYFDAKIETVTEIE